MHLRVDYDRVGIRSGKIDTYLRHFKFRHNLSEGYDAIIKSLYNSKTLVKYHNTRVRLGYVPRHVTFTKGLVRYFGLPWREVPKAPHQLNNFMENSYVELGGFVIAEIG